MVFMPQLAVAALGLGRFAGQLHPDARGTGDSVRLPDGGPLPRQLGSKVVIFVGTVLLTIGMVMLGLFNSNLGMFIVPEWRSAWTIGAAGCADPLHHAERNGDRRPRGCPGGDLTLHEHRPTGAAACWSGAWRPRRAAVRLGYSAAFLVIGGVSLVLTFLSLVLVELPGRGGAMQQNEDVAQLACNRDRGILKGS